MSGFTIPQLYTKVFGYAAPQESTPVNTDYGYVTAPIPDAQTVPGSVSFSLGIPPENSKPLNAGGVPPFAQDAAGVYQLLSAHQVAQQGGQLYAFSTDWATDNSGYQVGAVVAMTGGVGAWLNTLDGNTSDPDTGGSGWAPIGAYGEAVVPVTGGSVTLTAAQYGARVIAFTGTLGSDQTIIFPTEETSWLVSNQTAVAGHTFYCQTAAGTGVYLPVSSHAPAQAYEIYCDGTNICAVFPFQDGQMQNALFNEPEINDGAIFGGTIDGVTTGVTKSTGTDDNTMATTAFVQNVVAAGGVGVGALVTAYNGGSETIGTSGYTVLVASAPVVAGATYKMLYEGTWVWSESTSTSFNTKITSDQGGSITLVGGGMLFGIDSNGATYQSYGNAAGQTGAAGLAGNINAQQQGTGVFTTPGGCTSVSFSAEVSAGSIAVQPSTLTLQRVA